MEEMVITAGLSSQVIKDCANLIGNLALFKCPYSDGGEKLTTQELNVLCKDAELALTSMNKLSGVLANMRVDSIRVQEVSYAK